MPTTTDPRRYDNPYQAPQPDDQEPQWRLFWELIRVLGDIGLTALKLLALFLGSIEIAKACLTWIRERL